MDGIPKKIVESTETVNSEVATETTNAPQKVLGGYTDQRILPIQNVGVCIINFFYDKDHKFVNGTNVFIPNVKYVETINEDGTITNNIVHINA
jgi:hypothetical protein